jgi:hypothetical protein
MPIKSAVGIIALFALSVFFSVGVTAQPAETAKYVSLPSGSTIELDVKKSRIVFDAHTVVGANACVGKPEYNCLVGGDAIFVFPKRMPSKKTAWEYQGKNFKVQKKVEGQILGRKYSGFLITRPSEKDGYWYIYSPRDGLVAFGLAGQSANSTFLIEGRCGFGADGCNNS